MRINDINKGAAKNNGGISVKEIDFLSVIHKHRSTNQFGGRHLMRIAAANAEIRRFCAAYRRILSAPKCRFLRKYYNNINIEAIGRCGRPANFGGSQF